MSDVAGEPDGITWKHERQEKYPNLVRPARTPEEAARLGHLSKGTGGTEARAIANRVGALKREMKRYGVLPEHTQFMLNMMESGTTARHQIISMIRKELSELEKMDPEMPGVLASRTKLKDILLRAVEHEHGKAPTKIQQMNINIDYALDDNKKNELLESLKQKRT